VASRSCKLATTPDQELQVGSLTPLDPDFAARVGRSFAAQAMMRHLGAELVRVEPGLCEIALPFRAELTQQHGFLHAGAVISIADSAAGYAASSLMPADAAVLTVELKVNLLAPARGERLTALGRVRRAGRTLTVTEAEVTAWRDGRPTPVALLLGTMMAVTGRGFRG
jgi:uncharacterized protein (TIGR00369 family)